MKNCITCKMAVLKNNSNKSGIWSEAARASRYRSWKRRRIISFIPRPQEWTSDSYGMIISWWVAEEINMRGGSAVPEDRASGRLRITRTLRLERVLIPLTGSRRRVASTGPWEKIRRVWISCRVSPTDALISADRLSKRIGCARRAYSVARLNNFLVYVGISRARRYFDVHREPFYVIDREKKYAIRRYKTWRKLE